MNIQDYMNKKKKLEKDIKVAIENAIKVFKAATSYSPGKIKVEMQDTTENYSYPDQQKRDYRVNNVVVSIHSLIPETEGE